MVVSFVNGHIYTFDLERTSLYTNLIYKDNKLMLFDKPTKGEHLENTILHLVQDGCRVIASNHKVINLDNSVVNAFTKEFLQYFVDCFNNQLDVNIDATCGICDKCGAYQLLSYNTCNYNGVCNGKVVFAVYMPHFTDNIKIINSNIII